MSDLKDALTEIRGVGDATAEEILEVVAEYDTSDGVEFDGAEFDRLLRQRKIREARRRLNEL